MPPLVTINGHGIESMELTLPANNFFSLEARLAGDLGVGTGDPITLEVGSLTILADVSTFGSVGADRYNLCSFARGSTALRKLCTPTHIVNPTASAVLSAVGVTKYTVLQNAPQLPNYGIIVPGSVTGWQALRRYLGDDVRVLYDGTVEIGVRPQRNNAGTFQVIDYNAQNSLLTLGISDDFEIYPADILYGATVMSVKYEYAADEMRAICEMAGVPSIT